MASQSPEPKELNQICLELLLNQTIPLTISTTKRLQKQTQDITQQLDQTDIKDTDTDDVYILGKETATGEEVFSTLEKIGFGIGLRASELINYENPDLDLLQDFELLNVMKFICRDIWKYFYGKQINNLRTNHKGTFVLIDNTFKHFEHFSSLIDDRDTFDKSKLYTWLPSGIIRGALKSFDIDSVVTPEVTAFPKVSFNIQTNPK